METPAQTDNEGGLQAPYKTSLNITKKNERKKVKKKKVYTIAEEIMIPSCDLM